jgi:hypothetical protein
VVVLVRRHFDGFDSTINAWLRRSPVLAGTGGYRVYGKPPTSGSGTGHGSVTGASHTGARHHRSGGVKSS